MLLSNVVKYGECRGLHRSSISVADIYIRVCVCVCVCAMSLKMTKYNLPVIVKIASEVLLEYICQGAIFDGGHRPVLSWLDD